MNKTDQEVLILVAQALGEELLKEVVFVGGVTTSTYIENNTSPSITPTEDVDLIVKIVSQIEYEQFEKRIGQRGFKRNLLDPGPTCRFFLKEIMVDFMPLNEKILGFSNTWYQDGFENSVDLRIGQISIKTLSFPYFLATKLEAFESRGKNSFLWESKDFEDIVVVLNGRNNLVLDLKRLPRDVLRLFQN